MITMKKWIALFLTLLCSLVCACTTYKTTDAVVQTFQEHREAFISAANTFQALGIGGSVGFVHTPSGDRPPSFCEDSDTVWVELGGLHVHSEEKLSDKQVITAAAAAQKLMQEIGIDSISFCKDSVVFVLHDKNRYSWLPVLKCYLKDPLYNLTEGDRIGPVRVEENWYAYIQDY